MFILEKCVIMEKILDINSTHWSLNGRIERHRKQKIHENSEEQSNNPKRMSKKE